MWHPPPPLGFSDDLGLDVHRLQPTSTPHLHSIQLIQSMSGFFGFDSALPERRDQPPHQQQGRQQQQPFSGFQASNLDQTFGASNNQGEDEDLAVYTWGQGGSLMEGGDELNDETFGDFGDVGESRMTNCWLDRGGDAQRG